MAPFRISPQSTLQHSRQFLLIQMSEVHLPFCETMMLFPFLYSFVKSCSLCHSYHFLLFFNSQFKCHLFFERLLSTQVVIYLVGISITLVHPTITSFITLNFNFACFTSLPISPIWTVHFYLTLYA